MTRSSTAKDAKDARVAKDRSPNATMDIEHVGREIIDSGMKVHSAFGPGVYESVYKACLIYELRKRGLQVATEVSIPVIYDGVRLDAKFRVDLIVENCVIVELKAVERILDVHDAQLLSHLKLTGHKLGFRINFNVVHLKDGIKRMVNGL